MTHDELLGRIEEQDGNPLFEAFDSWLWSACSCDTEVGWTCGAHKNAQPLRLAIQDVLALHKKHEGMPNLQTSQGGFYQCVVCLEIYPCTTRMQITNRLGGME